MRTLPIDREDCIELEQLHYQVEARANLIERLVASGKNYDKFMEDFTEYYKKYSQKKLYVENKYKPADSNPKSWNVTFADSTITFEE